MNGKNLVFFFTLLVLGIYFAVVGIIGAGSFLKPLTFAILLTLMCVPLARKLESWKFSRGFASFTCVLLSLIAYLAFFMIITIQVNNVADRWSAVETQVKPKVAAVLENLKERTGLDYVSQFEKLSTTPSEQAESVDTTPNQVDSAEEMVSSSKEEILAVVNSIFNFLGSSMLTFIYIFFMLTYRGKIKKSLLMFFEHRKQEDVKDVINNAINLALNFIAGRFTLILFLAIIYSIGLSISGIENAILISAIAALLSLIPYAGVVLGYGLAIMMAVFSGANTWSLIGVSITYGLAQFIESYILEPYVVGSKVDLNPLVTIIVVVLGGSIWGVAGMILSIPLAGIAKIICDAVPALHPLAYALGGDENDSEEEQGFLSKWGEKIRKMFSN